MLMNRFEMERIYKLIKHLKMTITYYGNLYMDVLFNITQCHFSWCFLGVFLACDFLFKNELRRVDTLDKKGIG